jgi:transaldolase
MTIPPPLLARLASTEAPLPRVLSPAEAAAACDDEEVAGGQLSEAGFRMALNADVAATTKMAEGINVFVAETLRLEAALRLKLS